MCNEIIDKVCFGGVAPVAVPTGTGQVIHKIGYYLSRCDVHQPAQEQELVGQEEMKVSMSGVGAGLPF